MNTDPKHVYLIGNDIVGFHSHSFDKDQVKAFCKQRKNHYHVKKVKFTKKLKENLSVNTELCTLDGIHILSAIEEDYFLESWGQWQDDIRLHFIDEFLKYDKCIKYDKDEKKDNKELHKFLKGYISYMQYVYDNDIDFDEHKFYNYHNVLEFYIKYILENYGR